MERSCFKAQVDADRVAAFQAEGLPLAAIDDFMRASLISPDVQGYIYCDECCLTYGLTS